MFSHKARITIIFIFGISKQISSIHIVIFAFLFINGIYLKNNINSIPSGINNNKKYELICLLIPKINMIVILALCENIILYLMTAKEKVNS